MSKNAPSEQKKTNPPVEECRCAASEQTDYKKTRREVSSTEKRPKHRKVSRACRLPTPPPDPTLLREDDVAGKCPEFLEYLDSLQKSPHQNLSRTNSAFASTIATEDAFDHLEKLYKLMEQMLVLREQNTKLHRRVRDLEHLRNIQNMHKQLKDLESVDVPEVDTDTIFAETLLDTILVGTKRQPKQSQPSRFRQSILRRQRNRSNSITLDKSCHPDVDTLQNTYRRASALCNNQDKTSKVSKWTKVKAAFKWEKASQTVSDVKSQDSGISGMLPVNYEVARYLRVPSTSEEPSVSPADSGAAEISTPGTISPASSVEDIFCGPPGRKRIQEDTSDDDQSFSLEYIPHSKEESQNSSQKSKGHRTPWAKMKDIIQTRNSFKKRNRLSAKSDDFKADESDNEDVFENKETKSCRTPEEHEVPPEVIARYQQVLAEDSINRNASDDSKWTRVKKAFLSTPSISRTENASPVSPSSRSHFAREEITSRTDHVSKLQEEIQMNYRELQNKLSLEFQGKMQEWERIKHSASSNAAFSGASSLSPEEAKEQAFKKKMEEWEKIKGQPRHNLQLQSEEHLPPEFRKKLQEWQRIKKSATKDDVSTSSTSPKRKLGDWPKWKSISGHRPDASHQDNQPLSEDFLKKLESWKQIKASSSSPVDEYETKDAAATAKGNKTPSPILTRKEGSGRQSKKIKDQTEKELQWFEKELSKIEREKQRLERERQKFLEREERLTKLRLSVVGGNKKDILVHTPSGFYRFEGISRKFTQKLYEWEKAKGIGPEASTFALLSSCYVPNMRSINTQNETSPRLVKSKSADSVLNSELNLTHPLMSRDPSSLSLNDMENLENECLLDARISSVPDIIRSRENVDDEEPEAVIVEVEDIVEETAGPLRHYKEREHVPVYQNQAEPRMCEGETRAAPNVQRSESARAQNNYNLIEETIGMLRILAENEDDIGQHEQVQILSASETERDRKSRYLKNLYYSQKDTSVRLIDKLARLQEANTKVTSNIANEEVGYTTSRLSDVLDTVQDLSADLLRMAEKLQAVMHQRETDAYNGSSTSRQKYPILTQILSQAHTKILDLRRVLSYLCAASDSTAPGRKKKILRRTAIIKESPQLDAAEEKQESDSELNAQIAQGAIKKRYRYRQKGSNTQTLDESDDEDVRVQRKNKQKKTVQKLPSDAETNSTTTTNYENAVESRVGETAESPMQVFVKTTRKLFTPIVTSSFAVESRKCEVSEAPPTITLVQSFQENRPEEVAQQIISSLPPLPASPTPQRKLNKEISPNIRLMMVRYNQKIQEQEASGGRSGGSSGSSSPTAWRSPIAERRVKAQTERYQLDLLKLSPLLGGRREVQKSASLSVVNSGNKQVTMHSRSDDVGEKSTTAVRGILKSSSTNALTLKVEGKSESSSGRLKNSLLKLNIPELNVKRISDPEARTHKLLKAKEDFLNSPVSPMSAPPLLVDENSQSVKYPTRNRLSQISVGSESSYDSSACEGMLIKSASAGMINIDVDAYRQIHPEIHGGGYVSLPRSGKKRKEGIISNIASKFRKVKMRRNKDPNKMNTISTLCRQSLVVDINSASQETLTGESPVSSRKDSLTVPSDSKGSSSGDGDTSPSTSRSGSWIKRPKLFKSKR